MAITGNLKTFYLSSVLQLLSNDKKTGILELTDGNDIIQVYLRDGTIINAFGSSRVDRLTNYLRSEGIITEEQLQTCMKISAHTEKKIGMVLVEQGIISPEQLEDLLHRQIEQTLFSLFLWEQGEFQYRDQNFDLSGQIITSFDTMQVVLEASRRVDEISEIKKRVPMDHHVLAVNPDCSDQQKSKLTTVERAVLSLVNGKRTAKRVIADSGYDELKVYKTLFSLVTSGMILEENKILKRPEDIHEEIVEPADASVEAAGDAQSELKQPLDAHEETTAADHTDAETIDEAVQSENGNTADVLSEPAEELFDTPDDTQPDLDQEPTDPDEMILELELESEPDKDEQTSEQPISALESLDILATNADSTGKTVVKIDGKIIPEDEPRDKQPITPVQPSPTGKKQPTYTLQTFKIEEELAEDEEEYTREKQRLLKKVAVGTAAVITLAVVVLLLKMVLFPGASEQEPFQSTATEQQLATKKKPQKPVTPKIQKPVVPEEKKTGIDAVPAQPELTAEFFQDQKGWVSINLPSGFTTSEQPYQDRTSVSINYDNDVTISLSIVPESSEWNAEDAMYTAIVKMQEGGSQQVQKYTTLKHAGCPGYVVHFVNSRNQKSHQTALYRFVCYNKMVRLEVASPARPVPTDHELCQRIYTAIENSFFIYQ